MTIRPIKQTSISQPTLEGAGVKLNRVFGFGDTTLSDPFLLLDDFRNNKKEDFINGFPWHPHRGIETITYIIKGNVEHGDSLGNVGTLKTGDVQWLTAGSGILHQEMPKGNEKGEMHGFQLWANLPSSLKMTSPNYQDIPSNEIKEIHDDDGSIIRVIIGNYRGYSGPVKGISSDPIYLDIFIPANKIKTSSDGVRFLLIGGTPIQDPVAWHGPIVMNTNEELMQAMKELNNGNFIKK